VSFEVALKVDVDTHDGARDGIPRLMRLFDEQGVRSSFFVTMGPDNSGRAILRVFTRKGFLRKMLRTRAPSMYGWRTILSGTLLPARKVGSKFPALIRGIDLAGHDVGPHGWDHVGWHDRLRKMGEAEARYEFGRGLQACAKALGRVPEGSAAPGWQCSAASLAAQDDAGIAWHSDTRGHFPFVPYVHGREFRGLEIPSTLPTLDEVLGTPAAAEGGAVALFQRLTDREGLNVFTLHTESEGAAHIGFMRELIGRWKSDGATFVRLSEVAHRLLADRDRIPRAKVTWGEVPGRAGAVACQGETVSLSARSAP
jgi:undecaprenyl phosphate-alpha-L-ara4FN deformylase